jgi:hypothetical protein
MSPRLRDSLIVAAIFAVGVLAGFFLGRAGDDEAPATAASSPSPSGTASAQAPPEVVTPSPGSLPPAIGSTGAVLAEADRAVTAASSNAPCDALITPGVLGECGEVTVAGGRVVWVVESTPTSTGGRAFTATVRTYVPDENGWVEWLLATDPAGERWTDVNVLAQDLTGDGVAELVVGFRGTGDEQTLDVDIVSYTEIGLPEVVAHPGTASRGSATFAAGTLTLYAGQYPAGEPVCCPPSFLRQTVAFVDGFFRVTQSQDALPSLVPASQL